MRDETRYDAVSYGNEVDGEAPEQVNALLPPHGRHPYYIVVPRYIRTSAGIRCLHLLCHWLNRKGQLAYLLITPHWNGLEVSPELTTPIVTQAIASAHFEMGLTPIVVAGEVYEETVASAVRVHFIGNYPGLLGGPKEYPPDQLCFGYSKHLAEHVGQPENVLHIPPVNTRIFSPKPNVKRSGTCFYAAKFQDVYLGKVFGIPEDCFEITRDRPGQLTQEQLAELFQRTELLYLFEDSAIGIEAAMCGCPVVLMPSEFFSRPLAIEEAGWDGFAWGMDESELARARATVGNVYRNYTRNFDVFFQQLDHFVDLTQAKARAFQPTAELKLAVDSSQMPVRPSQAGMSNLVVDLKSRLGDAILACETLTSARSGVHALWTPQVSLAGAASRVTFQSGWGEVQPSGTRMAASSAVLQIAPVPGARWIELQVRSVDRHPAKYRVHSEGAADQGFSLDPGAVAIIHVPVIYPGSLLEVGIMLDQAISGLDHVEKPSDLVLARADCLFGDPPELAERVISSSDLMSELAMLANDLAPLVGNPAFP